MGLPEVTAGILGMSREGNDEFPSGPRLMKELVGSGVINTNMFSFYLSGEDGKSLVDLGDYV
jgi:hypothetical protein